MIPSKFDYVVARSLDQALQLLGKHGTDAKILSGGHSLIPLMKFRLATPSVVVDVGRLSDLRFIREEEEDIVVGGLATHHMLESSALLLEKVPVLSMAAARVGDVQVRNRGTIGGSLVHADPAADLPAAVLALNARIKVVGAGGEREIPADRFFVGMLESAVRPDEILTEVRVRKSDAGNGAAYLKVPQPASGFAVVGIATTLSWAGGTCAGIRIGVTGVGQKPYRAAEVESRLMRTSLDGEALRSACARTAEGIDVLSDIHASAEYRKELAAIYTRRCVEAAAARARG